MESERLNTALARLQEIDSFAAILYLQTTDDPLAASQDFDALSRHLYWEKKNLPAFIAIARAGIQYALTQAQSLPEDAEASQSLRSAGKTLAYNIASFTWSGWDEPGIVISPSDVAVGLDAARLNLRLAQELNKGELPLSRAHWIVGAQLLAAGQPKAAHEQFAASAKHAQAADAPMEVLLAEGFAALSVLCASGANPEAESLLENTKAQLAALPKGSAFVEQLNTAAKVFLPR